MKKLLFVLSCYHKDAGEALELTRWMRELGFTCQDRALFVTTRTASTLIEIGQIVQNLNAIFLGGVEHLGLTAEDERGPWFSNNFMFQSIARYVEHVYKDIDGWYNFEPDCVPVRKDWWERIKAEFETCEKPFMGDVLPINHNPGSPLHLNGSAIYPQNVAKYSIGAMRAHDQPFDLVGREEILPNAQNTSLIQTLFNTINYQENDGDIWTRYPGHGGVKGIPGMGPEVMVESTAVVIHGCKDASLLQIMRERLAGKKRTVVAPQARTKGNAVTALLKTDTPNEKIAHAAKNRRSLEKIPLTAEEERSVGQLITALELFCRNDASKVKVRAMLEKSELMAA